MATNFQIKNKTKSVRCEICHQTDLFDVNTETCSRCQGLVVSSSSPQNNYHFQDWMVTLGPNRRNISLSTQEIFSVIRQSLQLYWQRFFLFFSLSAVVLIPLSFLTENLVRSLGVTDLLYQIIIVYGFPFLAISLAIGTTNLAVSDCQQNQPTSFASVYQRLFKSGLRFIFTSVTSQLYQLIGLLFCWLGVLYTYPSGAFASEVAALEQKHGLEAFKLSHRIGMRTPILILLLGAFNWGLPKLVAKFVAEFFIYWGLTYRTSTNDYYISIDELTYKSSVFLQLFIFPLFLTIKTLLYLRLRPQELQHSESTSIPDANSSSTTFQIR